MQAHSKSVMKIPTELTYKCSMGPELLSLGKQVQISMNHHKNNNKPALNPLSHYSVHLIYTGQHDFKRQLMKSQHGKSHSFSLHIFTCHWYCFPTTTTKKSEMSDKCSKKFLAVSSIFTDIFPLQNSTTDHSPILYPHPPSHPPKKGNGQEKY